MNNQITSDIRYIGVNDADLDLFESQYKVPHGMAYNSYLIEDEKIAILDTVDARKAQDWKQNVEQALNGRQPDYIVLHHAEPDHASLVVEAMEKYPNVKLVTSAKAVQLLGQFFPNMPCADRIITVKEKDTLPLGKHTLTFFAAPMVHWPEVMVSYDSCDQVLFSADAFGKFGTLDTDEDWACEARRYYFNICGKYGMQVQAMLKKISALPIQKICSLHGPILTENIDYYLNLYNIWSKYEVEAQGVFIAYASIHGGTAATAHYVADYLRSKGVKVAMNDLTRDDMAEAIEDAFKYGKMIVAASSYDSDLFPPMYDFLHHLQLKGYQNRRIGMIENGSWAPSAGRVMKQLIEPLKNIDLVEPIVTIRSRQKPADEEALKALADAMIAD